MMPFSARPDLVRHRGEEIAFHLARMFGRLARLFGDGPGALGGFLQVAHRLGQVPVACFALAQALLGGVSPRDVAHRDEGAGVQMGHDIAHALVGGLDPAPVAIGVPDAMQRMLSLGTGGEGGEGVLHSHTILWMDEVARIGADEVVRFATENVDRSGRDVGAPQIEVDERDHVGGIVRQEPVTRFAGAQLRLRGPSLGDVLEDAEQAGRAPTVPVRLADAADPDPSTLRRHQRKFEVPPCSVIDRVPQGRLDARASLRRVESDAHLPARDEVRVDLVDAPGLLGPGHPAGRGVEFPRTDPGDTTRPVEERLVPPDQLLGLLLLRHVDGQDREPRQTPGSGQRRDRHERVAFTALRPDQATFELLAFPPERRLEMRLARDGEGGRDKARGMKADRDAGFDAEPIDDGLVRETAGEVAVEGEQQRLNAIECGGEGPLRRVLLLEATADERSGVARQVVRDQVGERRHPALQRDRGIGIDVEQVETAERRARRRHEFHGGQSLKRC